MIEKRREVLREPLDRDGPAWQVGDTVPTPLVSHDTKARRHRIHLPVPQPVIRTQRVAEHERRSIMWAIDAIGDPRVANGTADHSALASRTSRHERSARSMSAFVLPR